MADKIVFPSCLGLPCRLVHSRGVHSVTLFCPSVVVESCNVSCPSMYSLLDNVYGVIYICLMSYPGITCVVTQGNAEHDALHLPCATDSSSMRYFFSAHVSLPYTMTANTYSLCIFLFIFILACLLFMVLATLLHAAHPNAMRLLISDWHILHDTTKNEVPPCRLMSRKPYNKDAQEMLSVIPEDRSKDAWIAATWKQEWEASGPTRVHRHVSDPGEGVKGEELSRKHWTTLNRLRTGVGRCMSLSVLSSSPGDIATKTNIIDKDQV